MTESFLHYIWQFQYFHKEELQTIDGDSLQIFQPGIQNVNAGPDFSDARIKIGALEWRGSVEIHIKASGWNDHHHSSDPAYEKVVLHVVFDNDKPIYRTDGTLIPTLELKHRVEMTLWNRYKKLFTSVEAIPCSAAWPKVPDIIKFSMLDKAVMQRLEAKSVLVKTLLAESRNDWEETCFQLLCKNFGFKVNAEPMFQLAQLLPYKVLLKHLDKPVQIEALLLGQAGFLEKVKEDAYTKLLVREHRLLSTKYRLESKQMKIVQWRFLRLRPANFPTIRLAQLAALLSTEKNLFSKILECTKYNQLVNLLDIEQSEYWQFHYQLNKKSKTRVPSLGQSSIHNIMINTIVPLLVAYGQLQDDQSYVDRATEILQHLPAENNKITRQWLDLGYKVKSSFDSQGLIEMYNNFCMKRRCLDCTIGAHIIKATI